MSRMSQLDFELRLKVTEEIQEFIDAAPDDTPLDFVAGLETAIAIITHAIDARPEELKNAEA